MTADYVRRQIAGVWALAWNRPGWERALDRSLDGVFRSFWAAAIAAPFAMITFMALRSSSPPVAPDDPLLRAPTAWYVLANLATFAVDWFVGLAATLMAAKLLGAEKRAGDAVIAFNWSQAIVSVVQAAPFALLGFLGSKTGFVLLFVPAVVVAVSMSYGVARRALGLSIGNAVALVSTLMLLSTLVAAAAGAAAAFLYRVFS